MTKKNKLVGILSYNIYSKHMNYGAALHSYAFQQYLRKLGIDSVIIAYIPKELNNYNLKYPILNYRRIVSFKKMIGFIVTWGIGFFSNLRKYKKFQLFFDKFTDKTKKIYRYSELRNIFNIENLNFTDFVCESDVIWKLSKEDDFDDCFFLNFPAAKGKNKVAYSPTLASRHFTLSEEVRFKSLVSGFSGISTREKQGAEYLSNLLNIKIDWVLDPTLLLDSTDYEKIAIFPKEKGYVLLYNCMLNDRSMVKEAQRFASKKGKALIEISNFYVNKFLYGHKVKTDVGIEEFLGYFIKADYVICNAFHGFCLSVIFQKDVFLFLRNNKDYRMQSITSALGLSSRLIGLEKREIPKDEGNINWDVVYKLLNNHRNRSKGFINRYIG